MLTRVEEYSYPPYILCMCVCTNKRQCDRGRKSGYMNDCRAAHFVILLYLLAFVDCVLYVYACVCVFVCCMYFQLLLCT